MQPQKDAQVIFMSRPIWKGQISFGLVNIPVVLYSAEKRADLSFRLIDSRNAARVRYERVNEETGQEVPWDKIVKGYEYEDGNYVLLSDEELEHASVEMTRIIEIQEFVDLSQIDMSYFERPYVLVPAKNGDKGYVLLREAIAKSGKAGIASVVIRSRQYLAAVVADGNALLLELLRYPQELRDMKEFDLPGQDLRQFKVSKKEIELAEKLIDGMAADWNPDEHHDEYRGALMKMIERKIKSGQTEAIEDLGDDTEAAEPPKTINFMDVLKRSVAVKARSSSGRRRSHSRPAARKRVAGRKRTAKPRRAG
jgi:DNA end-binding protein Ku